MWLNGLLLIALLAISKCSEAELANEAAFQGQCGHGSPCDQLCYDLHDGMYECDCGEGFELNKNGYSCQEINSTFMTDGELGANFEEDVLYQRGASFSAKLDDPRIHQGLIENSLGNGAATKRPTSTDGKTTATATNAAAIISLRPVAVTRPPLPALPPLPLYANTVDNNRLNLRNTKYASSSDETNDEDASDITAYIQIQEYLSQQQQQYPEHNPPQPLPLRNQSTAANDVPIKSVELCTVDCGVDGVCELVDGITQCRCPFGKRGQNCDEDIKINTPRFTKNSWMAFPALRDAYKHVQLHIEFRPESTTGIILLTGERDDLTGDFMALLINQGFIELWFDCGSGTGKVRTDDMVVLNEWNTVTISRHRWDAWVMLNQGARAQGRSKGLFSRITFREPVFLGGSGNITGLAKRLPIWDGMEGCIRKFAANEHEYVFANAPFGDVTRGFDVQECITDRCSVFPCRHNGKCLPSDVGAVCLCPLGFGGDLCEIRLDLQVPQFNGSSYLRYSPLGDSAMIWLEMKIILKPQQEDGLVLYSGHHEYGDFISICLNVGHIEFTFDLGSGPATVRSEFPLALGQWHTVKISRTARLAVLKIDQLPEVMTISPNGFWHLSLPHSIYLGGIQSAHLLLANLRERGAFVGCIQKLEINGRQVAIIDEALGGSNVDNCPHACTARPCGPLAQCVPSFDSYECQCSPANVQCNQAEEVSSVIVDNEKSPRSTSRDKQTISATPSNTVDELDDVVSSTPSPLSIVSHSAAPLPWPISTSTSTSTPNIVANIIIDAYSAGDTQLDLFDQSVDNNIKATEYDDRNYDEYIDDGGNVPEENTEQSHHEHHHRPPPSPPSISSHKYDNDDDDDDDDDDKNAYNDGYNNDDQDDEDQDEDDVVTNEANDDNDDDGNDVDQDDDENNNSNSNSHRDNGETTMEDFDNQEIVDFTTESAVNEFPPEAVISSNDDTLAPSDAAMAVEPINGRYMSVNIKQLLKNDELTKRYGDKRYNNNIFAAPPHTGSNKKMYRPSKQQQQQQQQQQHHHHHHQHHQSPSQSHHQHLHSRSDNADTVNVNDNDNGNNVDVDNLDDRRSTSEAYGKYYSGRDGEDIFHEREVLADIDKIMKDGDEKRRAVAAAAAIAVASVTSANGDKKSDTLIAAAVAAASATAARRNHGACFTGTDSYFHYSDAETMRLIISYQIDLNLRFKTHSSHGLILWSGRHTVHEDDDFLSLGIENGYLHLRYDLGSGEVNIRYNSTKVSDGLWHRIRAVRNLQEGSLEVDDGRPIVQRSPGKLRQLNTDTGLYVGGMPDALYFTRRKYTSGIVGCISEVILAGELRLNFDSSVLGTAHNVEPAVL